MLDVKAITALLKVAGVTLVTVFWMWKTQWPSIELEAAMYLITGSFIAGAASVSAYFLIRYRHELTPATTAAVAEVQS